MKKGTKKLTLHRETLHHLARIAGGSISCLNCNTGVTQFSGCGGAQCETGTYPCAESFCICD